MNGPLALGYVLITLSVGSTKPVAFYVAHEECLDVARYVLKSVPPNRAVALGFYCFDVGAGHCWHFVRLRPGLRRAHGD